MAKTKNEYDAMLDVQLSVTLRVEGDNKIEAGLNAHELLDTMLTFLSPNKDLTLPNGRIVSIEINDHDIDRNIRVYEEGEPA